MDSSRKRKASNATPSSNGTTAKKIKLLNSTGPDASEVQQVGLKLVGMLHNAQDKYGRSVADAFLTLPPRDEIPDYYQVIQLPIAIDTIEAKLRRNAYPTITTLESDLKRMVQNAKDYNQPKSDIYEDAERIRKLVYNYMKLNNPQYRLDPTYSSFPTPIPKDNPPFTNGHVAPEPSETQPTRRDSSARAQRNNAAKDSEPPSERRASTVPSAAGADADVPVSTDFTGKTFQEAQHIILAELLQYTDEDGLEIFTPFINLPSRKLEDYYRVTKHPVSIKSVQKRARGQHGRNPPTGVTDFKTWDAFEEEVSFIWRNAQSYNEDGSEMFELAGEFRIRFKERLAEAKEKIEEPAGTRIKLGASRPKSGITLNLTQHRDSPTPGVTVDAEALARQRQLVQAGSNSRPTEQQAAPAINGISRRESQVPSAEALRAPSAAASATSPSILVKDERLSTNSPAPNILSTTPAAAVAASTATAAAAGSATSGIASANGPMAPPLTRLPSASPYPAQTNSAAANSFHYTAPALLPPTTIRTYPVAQALLPVVTISQHPQLKVAKPYSLALLPHVSLSQQSTTVTLPSSYDYLQIAPTISKELSMGRAYKMFVTVNGFRLTQRDTHFHADSGKRTHMYEARLAQGVNRIEVEVVATKPDGSGDSKGLDVEKVTVFANLMRA